MSTERGLDAGLRRRLWGLGLALLLLLALTAAWRWSPLADLLRPERLVPQLRELAGRLGMPGFTALLTLALMLAVPLVLLTLVSMLALGPLWGSVGMLVAAQLAAALNYGLGRALGHELLLRLAGPRLQRLSRQLERHGLWAVIALRLVPVAPFAIVNMACSATHLRLRDMLLGTGLGMLPGTLAIALFSERILAALQSPSPTSFGLLALTLGLIAAGAWGLRRWLARSE